MEKMEEFFRGRKLRWYGQVEKIGEKKAPATPKSFEVDGLKKGRQKKR